MHPHAQEAVNRHLTRLDETAPGLLKDLYLVGSCAVGGYCEGPSDIDFVAVLSRRPGKGDLEALSRVHAEYPARPLYEGIYVTEDQFADPPKPSAVVPHAYAGRFNPGAECCLVTPMTWLELTTVGLPVRGRAPRNLAIKYDISAIRPSTTTNLIEYWRPLLVSSLERVCVMDPGQPSSAGVITWIAFSLSRAHFTYEHRQLVSKTNAGCYARDRFPRWEAVINRALAWRSGESVQFTAADARKAVELGIVMVDDVLART